MMSKSMKTPPFRCAWCLLSADYTHYHDHVWGVPIVDDDALFAALCLEVLQAGLSFYVVFKKRHGLCAAFDGFNATIMANYSDDKIHALANDVRVIRHKAKIIALKQNARAYLAIKSQGSFYDFITQYIDKSVINYPKTPADIPTTTPQAIALCKALKKAGFQFLGHINVYAFMQATGFVDDHLIACVAKRASKRLV